MQPASRWYGQKAGASTFITSALADGQEKSIETLIEGLRAEGLSRKNALKALYSEVVAGTVTLTGTWSDATFKKAGA